MLDFATLYAIILLNSLSFIFVWAIFVTSYPTMVAARYWLLALTLTGASGLALMASDAFAPLGTLALTMVCAGFCMMWLGMRVFLGLPPRWTQAAGIVVTTLLFLIVFSGQQRAVNVISAISQVMPVSAAIMTISKSGQRTSGALTSNGAGYLILAGQGSEALSNLLRLTGHLEDAAYYTAAPLFLVATIIGGTIWNLGFVLMVTDRFRSDLDAIAKTDELTGLLNRRALREIMAAFDASPRAHQKMAIMMADLDKFKAINDTYSHAAGDAALAHISAVIRKVLRREDIIARFGGDEFCILLPGRSRDEARAVADRIAQAVAQNPLIWNENVIHLRMTFGFSAWDMQTAKTLTDMIAEADAALLQMKRGAARPPIAATPQRPD